MKYMILAAIFLFNFILIDGNEKNNGSEIIKSAYGNSNISLQEDSGFGLIEWPIINGKLIEFLPFDSTSIEKMSIEQRKHYFEELKQLRSVKVKQFVERRNGIQVLLSTGSVRAWIIYSDINTDSVIAVVRIGGSFDGVILDQDSLFSTNGVEYVRKFLDIE